MKIGIDIDGVLIDFEERMRAQCELFNLFYRKNNKIINENEYWIQKKYNWSKEDWNTFSKKYLLKLSEESDLKPCAPEVLNLLKEDGHELIVISNRGNDIHEMIDVVMKKILDNNIKFDKYYWKETEKINICKMENIDIMIDDSPAICKELVKNNIKTFYFKNIYNEPLPENEFLKAVYNWGNIYYELSKSKDHN